MLFPNMVLHFDVGRKKSLAALEQGMMEQQKVFLISQKNDDTEDPGWKDLCKVGTVAEIKQVMNLPGENIRVLVEGAVRGVIQEKLGDEPSMKAVIKVCEDKAVRSAEAKALLRTAQDLFEEYARTSQRVGQDTVESIHAIEKPGEAADLLAANVLTKREDRQEILDELNPMTRLEKVCAILMRETDMADTEKQIQARIRKQVEKNQKDYYLREQIKAIQTELGDGDEAETADLRKRMENTPLNDEARAKCEKELDRLSRMAPGSPEASVSLTYVEWILDLPWGKETEDNLDLNRAREILNRDHYGLDDVKERIIEYLAVLQLKKDMKGPILCFVGPPGVGKTSIVKAIAEAVGRKFVQVSLGGVRDEAEIRGHRRTYIGSIPGRIIAGMKQAGTSNPVFLFDEIDKMSHDFRGDPASAMLEALDPAQNNAFRDHYLEVPFDLSDVLFITTANTLDTVDRALLDRMEVIEVPSYTSEEKLQIAKRHLLPKQLEAHNLQKSQMRLSDKAFAALIDGYTRESGVRTLERQIAKLCRRVTLQRVEDPGCGPVSIKPKDLKAYLGAPRYIRQPVAERLEVGVVNGLAWTSVGGEVMPVEALTFPGKGEMKLTGQLGEVMRESAELARSVVRARLGRYGVPSDFFEKHDVHIHVPEGAVPKDGPSAGVALSCALMSAVTGAEARGDWAMTGEITLHGRVLPIGGVKEKLLAAYRQGITRVLLPRENEKDLEKIDPVILAKFELRLLDDVDGALGAVLVSGRGEAAS